MVSKKEIWKFVNSQESLHLYAKMKTALSDVLSSIPDKEYHEITKNLQILSLQEGIIGQGMIFPNPNGKYKIISIVYIPAMPMDVLRFIIAHELGHIHQGRHKLKKGEETYTLERYANKMARKWGFPADKKIWSWIFTYMKKFKIKFPKDWPVD